VAISGDVDPATLPQRLVAETIASGGCAIGPLMTGAWTRTAAMSPANRESDWR
jgi:hypothetical protein